MSELLTTSLLTVVPGADPAAVGAAVRSTGSAPAVSAPVVVGTTLPGAINGGDVLVHGPASHIDSSLADADVSSAEVVSYRPGRSGRRGAPAAGNVYRTLLLGVRPDADADLIRRFEQDLLTMPGHLTSMLWWRLSRVESVSGPTAFTHVWEQVFTGPEGLSGQYMLHPVHWGLVDRWFDPEVPEHITLDRLCHVACVLGHDDVVS
ncbi:Dabb family protein [Gordonia neofelifaecis]|uniref:Stress-response A/B barrel domain-containing protein n=1 Tax=Gordonia neofelifaecis NRRL B-59395 TaxID=644548 RepID=F1YPH2_9ACTN|nr:Dabb family protein [Gordonia neofelifaecis]EGD53423.1 hypothetical protein SCNU_19135 [Gordonia neofelifaecis NRRL B-59395]